MKALILGAGGQDGFYLTQLCKARKIEPICVSRYENHLHANIADFEQVDHLVATYLPDIAFHLAARSTTSHEALFENHETISTGTVNLLEAIKRRAPKSKVFITGSGVQFVNRGNPISERDEFEANSPYSVARIHSVFAARYYRSLGMKVYVGYLFHHESPKRKPNHVSQQIVNAAKRITAGSTEKLELGDITVEKEWTFAGDIVKGILTLVQQDEVFEATVGSGIAYSIKDWLVQCFGTIGKNWQDFVQIRKDFVPEYRKLVSNPSTINSLGWKAETSLASLAKLMMSAG